MNYNDFVPMCERACAAAVAELHATAADYAARNPGESVFAELRQAMTHALKTSRPSHGLDASHDGRAKPWRVRLIIQTVGIAQGDEIVSDTDPERPLAARQDMAPGDTVIHGLGEICGWAVKLIAEHHGQLPPAISVDGMRAKLGSLRTAIYTQQHMVAWRHRYSIDGADYVAIVYVVADDGARELTAEDRATGLRKHWGKKS
jgi:hypothetical protein